MRDPRFTVEQSAPESSHPAAAVRDIQVTVSDPGSGSSEVFGDKLDAAPTAAYGLDTMDTIHTAGSTDIDSSTDGTRVLGRRTVPAFAVIAAVITAGGIGAVIGSNASERHTNTEIARLTDMVSTNDSTLKSKIAALQEQVAQNRTAQVQDVQEPSGAGDPVDPSVKIRQELSTYNSATRQAAVIADSLDKRDGTGTASVRYMAGKVVTNSAIYETAYVDPIILVAPKLTYRNITKPVNDKDLEGTWLGIYSQLPSGESSIIAVPYVPGRMSYEPDASAEGNELGRFGTKVKLDNDTSVITFTRSKQRDIIKKGLFIPEATPRPDAVGKTEAPTQKRRQIAFIKTSLAE